MKSLSDPLHEVVVVRIDDPKKGTVVGYAVLAWSKRSLLDEMATIRTTAAIIGTSAAALCIAILWLMLRLQAARPLRAIRQSMHSIADGDLSVDIPFERRGDEIGEMARSVAVFRDNGLKIERLSAEKAEAEQAAQAEREATRRRQIEAFHHPACQAVRVDPICSWLFY